MQVSDLNRIIELAYTTAKVLPRFNRTQITHQGYNKQKKVPGKQIRRKKMPKIRIKPSS